MDALLYVLDSALRVLYVPCELLLGWLSYLPPGWGVAVLGVLTAAGAMALQKWASRQKLLGQCRADLRLLKKRARVARDSGDREAAARLRGLIGRISGKYMWGALKPALWSIPIIGILAAWAASRLGYMPIRPGESLTVIARFEPEAAGFAHVVPVEGIELLGPAIAAPQPPPEGKAPWGEAEEGRPQDRMAQWTLRSAGEGTRVLQVRHAGRTYEVTVPVSARGGRPPEPPAEFNRETPGRDQLRAILFDLQPTIHCRIVPVLPAWKWNLDLQWMGVYLWVALLCVFPFRFLFKVQ